MTHIDRADDPPPVTDDHHDKIQKAIDGLFDYKNDRFKCSVDQVIEQVAPLFPMCSFKAAKNKLGKDTVHWEDKIKKPKPIKPDDMTNVITPRFSRR